MKKTISVATIVTAIIISALALTGCSSYTGTPTTPEPASTVPANTANYVPQAKWVDLPDGRRVLCVSQSNYTDAGISCDWDHTTSDK